MEPGAGEWEGGKGGGGGGGGEEGNNNLPDKPGQKEMQLEALIFFTPTISKLSRRDILQIHAELLT